MSRATWSSDQDFSIDGVTYRTMVGRTEPGQMVLLKPRETVESLERLLHDERPRTIVELGTYAGGSTALLAQLARPEKLVTIDLSPYPCEPLETFVNEHGLRGIVVPRHGIDQANTEQLDEIMTTEFGGAPVDLIIDDASHLEAPTRASFNWLYPHLRPGGAYLIEDWTWPHLPAVVIDPTYEGVTPLSALVCELVLAAACRPRVVTEVTVTKSWALIRRGPATLRPGRFDISASFDPVGREMVDGLSTARTLKST